MRLLHYTIIIWMGLLHSGEPDTIHFEPIDEPSVVRHKPPFRPIEPIKPIRPRPVEPVKPIHPIDPIPLPHLDPVLPKLLPHPDPIGVAGLPVESSPVRKGPSDLPPLVSVTRSVQTYLSQHSQLPEALSGIELPHGTGRTVEQIRVQYLERMQKSFDQQGLIIIPKVVLTGASSFIQKGIGPSLVEWMVAITDGLSFAEHLSQLPTATETQRQQFSFSPEKKLMYESAKTALVQSAQNLLDMVASLHKQYADLFVMGKKVRDFTEEEVKGFSDTIDAIKALLKSSMEQREALVTLLCEKSASYTEALLSAVIDSDAGLQAWKVQEKVAEQNVTVVFASYEIFMSGFLTATNSKEYVQRFIGTEKGQFPSVQALVTALDKIGFILEAKNFWLSFRYQKYSKKTVDTILSSLLKEYPDVYIPSKKFILQYCKLHRVFKPVSFFIPHYDQFLVDAKTLTIDELAKKYGQQPEFIKSLLNNTYEALYVLQQTNQDKQARDLTEIVRRILLEHPEMTPDMIAQVVASENVPIRTVFDVQVGLSKVAIELKNEIVALQTGQFQKSLTGFSAQLSRAQTFVMDSFSRAQSFLTDKAADAVTAFAKNSRLGKVLAGVLEQLERAENSFAIVAQVKENITINSSAISTQYQEAFEQLQSLKQDAMVFAVQVEYEKAKAQQDKFSVQLLTTLQDAIKKELLSYTKNYLINALFEITTSLKSEPLSDESLDADGGSKMDALIGQIVDKSVLEQENEKDYQACIWASNKMGMMESKIKFISTLLKIKKTPLFLAGYKTALKDIDADFLFLSTSKSVQKCLNVIAKRSFLLQKIKDLEKEVKALQEEIDNEQDLKSGSQQKNKHA